MEGSTQAPLGAQSTDVHHEAQPTERVMCRLGYLRQVSLACLPALQLSC